MAGLHVAELRIFDLYFLFVAALSAAISHMMLYYSGACSTPRRREIYAVYAGPFVTLLGLLFFGSAVLARVSGDLQDHQKSIELYQAMSLVLVAMLACSVFIGLPLRELADDRGTAS